MPTKTAEQRLAELRDAYDRIIRGEGVQSVSYQDTTVRYGEPDLARLDAEIGKLEREVQGSRRYRAVGVRFT